MNVTNTTMTSLSEETRTAVIEAEDDLDHCLVCYTELSYTTLTPCDHSGICPVCHLRLRYLHDDKKCPICKSENEKLVVDHPDGKKFEDYPIWGNDLGSDFTYSEKVGMFFPVEYYEREIRPLFGFHCTLPSCDFDGTKPDPNIYEKVGADGTKHKPQAMTMIRMLQDHLRNKHRLTLCQLCVDNHRDFVSKLPRFTPSKLKIHLQKGDGPGSGFEGHPLCEFCKPTRYYDITQLHQHLNKDHYKCHVCERQGLNNQFYKNYRSLEKHFDQHHFLCHDAQCLDARFVVFENELDLRHHERQVHGEASTGSSKIQLEFRYRRNGAQADPNQDVPSDSDFNYNVDGTAFVPADLPQSAGNLNLHPMHIARTNELQAQAAALRDTRDQEQSFPTLAETNAEESRSSQPLQVGWTSGSTLKRLAGNKKIGHVTEEDFPSLPAAPPKRPSAAERLKFSNVNSQFAAMNASAGWRDNNAAIASNRPVPTNTSSFTSLSSATLPKNSQTNLAEENFPSLGPSVSSSQPHRYLQAETLAKKNSKKTPIPSWDNPNEFPAPPISSNTSKPVRSQILSRGETQPSESARANILQAPSANSKATVDDIKAYLGPPKYKQLKKYTKEFAASELAPDAFVDHAASLFEQGYGDNYFWAFLPSLIESCPNEMAAAQALSYMENLRRLKNGAANAEALRHPNAQTAPRPSHISTGWPSASASQVNRYHRPVAAPSPIVVPGKKKAAWGGEGTASVVVAKAPPGSVASAATSMQPKTGTATKYMAKQAKMENYQQNNSSGSSENKKNKKKQNKELRDLAFG